MNAKSVEMVDISVVIVNYNVKYFLELCLVSVDRASTSLKTEVIVVDNNSQDRSEEYITAKFPNINFIANKENVGFSKANNQAISVAKGRYILILNPDTIIAEDTIHKCFQFIEAHPNAGALGVPMFNGEGKYLKESKRAFPTPTVAFNKIIGLSTLFPKSKRFAKYSLGYLDPQKTHEVEILSGAFMFMQKDVLDRIGYFDESFFMYGEDIDLSYRVILAGYSNFYFSETSIIHFKGECTKKGSLNYVAVFYKAMELFANKYFAQQHTRIYRLVISAAIWLRASLSILKRIINFCTTPFRHFKAKSGKTNKQAKQLIIGAEMDIEQYKITSQSTHYDHKNLIIDDLVKFCIQNKFNEVVLLLDYLTCKQVISITKAFYKSKIKIIILPPNAR